MIFEPSDNSQKVFFVHCKIIEQDIIRISHGHEVKNFILKGQNVERIA